MFNWLRRKTDLVVVTAGSSATAEEAMLKMRVFTTLVTETKVELVSADGKSMTIAGRADRVQRFQRLFNQLQALEMV